MNRSSKTGRVQLLPDGTGLFFRHRLIELTGLAFLLLAISLTLAFLSYDANDPGFNRASDGPVSNLLGLAGANTASFLLPFLGLSVYVLPLILAAWCWRCFKDHSLKKVWLRILLIPLLLACLSLSCAALPGAVGWLGQGQTSSLGGTLGVIILKEITAFSKLPSGIIALIALAPALPCFAYAAALKGGEWKQIFRSFGRGLLSLVKIRDLVQRQDEDDSATENDQQLTIRRKRDKAIRKRAQQDRLEPVLEGKTPTPSRVETPLKTPQPSKRVKAEEQGRLNLGKNDGEYELPPISMLNLPPENIGKDRLGKDALEKNARLLETVLEDFGVRGEIVTIRPGPVVTLYELEPAPGTKTSRVVGLADDIARSMSALSVRVAVVPGSSTIGIELPNSKRETVYLQELMGSKDFEQDKSKLPIILGKDIGGNPSIVDLARMPHLLIAGTTGSGKSVAVNAMILSLLYRFTPDECKFIMIDPKMLELSVYDNIPHLLAPVVTEPKKAVVALKWTVREMEDRYRAMSRLGVRNIDGYNARMAEARKNGEVLTRKVQTGFDPETGQPIHEEQPFDMNPLPYIVVVVDEMADLMLVAGKDIEGAIQRLAQMARAAGIHIMMATQRPSVDVITGTIKANFPTRVSFHVTSKIDSRTILGEQGAEQLLGQGDMLYMGQGGRIQRVHGPLVTDEEVEEVVGWLKKQARPSYIESVTAEEGEAGDFDGDTGSYSGGNGNKGDELYDSAVAVVIKSRKASTSFVQRQLQIGYNRAATIIERMEDEGLISSANHVGKREVLVPDRDE
ncbi:DNA translocase FtsK 4TM domain-containing protein [Kiloniella laminariae]|uniref:DNA translocase FtsK n=1 Tax=Kiloniella laminariae TaxID=454162 RepID=A0ABT4LJ51_9PROT|nr:DNA translocase FtsK [Kiloniella laminariae]MCZ4281138.1 DNA translocase FtsK 4TM domain-containing protein [Kiloniella laminariae]